MAKQATKKAGISKKKLKKLIITMSFCALALICGVTMINQLSDISRLNEQKAEISAQLDTQNKENKELQAVVDSEDKDSYIEQKAREKGYVKSNEIVFYDISATE